MKSILLTRVCEQLGDCQRSQELLVSFWGCSESRRSRHPIAGSVLRRVERGPGVRR